MVGVAMAYPGSSMEFAGPAGWYERFAAFIARRAAFEGGSYDLHGETALDPRRPPLPDPKSYDYAESTTTHGCP